MVASLSFRLELYSLAANCAAMVSDVAGVVGELFSADVTDMLVMVVVRFLSCALRVSAFPRDDPASLR